MAVIPMLMILKEPDLGSAMVWGPTFVGMIMVGSIPFRYLIVLLLAVLTFLPIAFFFGLKDYQRERITTYIDMLTNKPVNIQEAAWVPYHLQLAVGSAGFQGKHQLAHSSTIGSAKRTIHETFFPNEAINDFISGVICEEFGFRGMLLLITGMSLLIFQCIFVAFYSRDQMGRLVVVGIVATLMTYMFMNIGMNMLLVPITGLPLPFISYGGTFMVVVLFMIGLVQSVWVHRNISPVRSRSSEREDDEE
jgi:rod shape determining protein RodA